ncbi:MAG TPA: polysaccharide biosynthesis tyrosine autokinase, partial [Anaerolineaceae bacterium]|nr:polysaccharide biosynthesis tyrosine autokinase [Anaerolineaceae bacterium]
RNLRSRTKVFLVPTTQLIEVTVEAPSPEVARLLADEVTRQFILYSPTLDSNSQNDERTAFIEERLERLKEKITVNQAEIDRREEAYLKAGLESERQAIEKEITRLEGLVSTWENNYSRLLIVNESNEASNYVAVIEPAQAGNSPVRPDVQTNVLLAGVIGLVLGLAVIFLLDNLDDTLKSEEALEQAVHLIPLGVVTQMKNKKEDDKLVTAQNPFSATQEAFRMIRSNIQFMAVDRPSKTIMITSTDAGDGKSLTAANMGLAMAQAGLRTILVDADLRQPKLHTLFKMNNREGLTDLLAPSELDLTQVLKGTMHEHLQILTSGTRPPNPTELLGSQRMRQLLAALSEMADVVILDSMPVLPVADSAVLSNRVDGVILVVDSTRTRRSDLKKAIQVLEKADAKIWGAVLNRMPRSKARYYGKDFVPDQAGGKVRLKSFGR